MKEIVENLKIESDEWSNECGKIDEVVNESGKEVESVNESFKDNQSVKECANDVEGVYDFDNVAEWVNECLKDDRSVKEYANDVECVHDFCNELNIGYNVTISTDHSEETLANNESVIYIIYEENIWEEDAIDVNECLTIIDSIKLYRSDIEKLTNNQWLNDKLVDAYLYLVKKIANRKVLMLSSYFFLIY